MITWPLFSILQGPISHLWNDLYCVEWDVKPYYTYIHSGFYTRLWNDLYCVKWDVKLYYTILSYICQMPGQTLQTSKRHKLQNSGIFHYSTRSHLHFDGLPAKLWCSIVAIEDLQCVTSITEKKSFWFGLEPPSMRAKNLFWSKNREWPSLCLAVNKYWQSLWRVWQLIKNLQK